MALDTARKKEILETVSKLRVTDIRDGLDWVGLHHNGTVSPEIRPLWRTKAAGFALTCRHIPTQQTVPTMTPDEYTKWAYEYWYGQVFDNDLGDHIDEHTFLVVDTCNTPTPAVGSMDSMIWAALGARGVLTNGGTRDSDETLEQKAIPIWSRWIVQPMYQGRVEWGGHSVPVEIGGSPGQSWRPRRRGRRRGDRRARGRHRRRAEVRDPGVGERQEGARPALRPLGIQRNESTDPVFDVAPHPYEITRDAMEKRLRRT